MIKKTLALVALSFLTLSANAAIYNLDRTIGAGTVTGFIETDGTIGVLTTANITDWVLTLTAPNLRNGPTAVIGASFAGSTTTLEGTALTASATGLTWDFSAAGSTNFFQLVATPVGGSNTNIYSLNQCFSGFNAGECIARDIANNNGDAQVAARTGQIEIAVAAVPVPAAAWLFGSALIGLAGIKRKQ